MTDPFCLDAMQLTLVTNQSRDIELAGANGLTWLIESQTGSVHLLRASNAEIPGAVSLFKGVDLSKPVSATNMIGVAANIKTEVQEVSEKVWVAYRSGRK